ncbi:MAG: glycerol-3-phosphate acyltransferase [Armatimonadota bacterium]
MAAAVLACLVAYLVGSIPSGYLIVRALRGVDVRDYGSKNVGAINVFRAGGRWLGIATLLADVGKAVGVVVVVGLLGLGPWVVCAAALSVMVGHALSAWFLLVEGRLSEGKSVACFLGVVVGLAWLGLVPWQVAAVPPALWVAGLAVPRLVTGRWWLISPVTMTAAVSVPVLVWLSGVGGAPLLLSVAMALLVLARHRSNIIRLWHGTEPRLGERHRDVARGPTPGASDPPRKPGRHTGDDRGVHAS